MGHCTGRMEKHTAEDAERQRAQRTAEQLFLDRTTDAIIRGAIAVHSVLGPGLLESAYEACLCHELRDAGLKVDRQVELPVIYKGVRIHLAYRLDLVVEDSVIVDLKAVTKVPPIHLAQLQSYLRLTGLKVGLLMNFHVHHLRNGI